jgi:hypothetical protein
MEAAEATEVHEVSSRISLLSDIPPPEIRAILAIPG